MLGPDGEPQTDTPEFKRWFGQSKVVENGEPLRVYHATQADFSEYRVPAYFARRPIRKAPMVLGARFNPCYLRIEKPKETHGAVYRVTESMAVSAKIRGHDGVIQRSRGRVYFVIFSPLQVKSATGNRGTFDPEIADVRF